jgi:NAD(P)H dehydrogenase (quinone)
VGFAACKAFNSRFSLYIECRAGVHNVIKAEKLKLLEKVQQCMFDTSAPETIRQCLRGCDRLFLVPPNVENRVEVCKFIIDAAKIAGVNFVCLLSMLMANTRNIAFGKMFGEIEDYLKDSGLQFCILRSNLYMENTLAYRFHISEYKELVTPLSADTRVFFGFFSCSSLF